MTNSTITTVQKQLDAISLIVDGEGGLGRTLLDLTPKQMWEVYNMVQTKNQLNGLLFSRKFYTGVERYLSSQLTPDHSVKIPIGEGNYGIDVFLRSKMDSSLESDNTLPSKLRVYTQDKGFKGMYLPEVPHYISTHVRVYLGHALRVARKMVEIEQSYVERIGSIFRKGLPNTQKLKYQDYQGKLHQNLLNIEKGYLIFESIQQESTPLLSKLGITVQETPIKSHRLYLDAGELGIREYVYSKDYIDYLKKNGYTVEGEDSYVISKGEESYRLSRTTLEVTNVKLEHLYGLIIPRTTPSKLGLSGDMLGDYLEARKDLTLPDSNKIKVE